MDFDLSPRCEELRDRIRAFKDEHVYPNEAEALRALDDEVRPGVPYPEILVEIRERARSDGLWNLFLPDDEHGAGLTNWEYGVLCEEMGRSPAVAPMAFNCSAPDTGNMEILADHGTAEQQESWLQPLLDGEIRSCFSMTEPEVSGSDPTTLQTRAELDGDEWVINGHKWFTSGAVGASLAIAMVVTDPDAPSLRAGEHDPRAGRQSGLQPGPAGAGDGPRRRPRATARSSTRTAACRPQPARRRAAPAS